ncbi:MAG: hypothetical protein WA110_04740, partial [Anaerolineaceae bacterium]
MKRLCLLVILTIFLAGCGTSEGLSRLQCDQDICINIKVNEPVLWGEQIIVQINVITKKNYSNLSVTFEYNDKEIVVEEPELQEPGRVTWKGDQGVTWSVDTIADQPVVFERKLQLPSTEGYWYLSANTINPEGSVIGDYVNIHLTREGGKVYYSGTPMPTDSDPVPTLNESQRMTQKAWPT